MTILFSLSIALFAGLMLSRLAKILQLPAVTAYLIAGIIVGPFCLGSFGVSGLGFINKENLESLKVALENEMCMLQRNWKKRIKKPTPRRIRGRIALCTRFMD